MSDSKDEVIQFKEPVQVEEIEKAFKISDIQCIDEKVAYRVAQHVSNAIKKKEIITRQKMRTFFIRCI